MESAPNVWKATIWLKVKSVPNCLKTAPKPTQKENALNAIKAW